MSRPVLRTTARGKQGPTGPQGERGPKGDQGPQGERGLPGVNATPADEAVAAYLAAEESESRAGARAAVAADVATPGNPIHSALTGVVGAEVAAGTSPLAGVTREYRGTVANIARRLARRPPDVIGYDFFDRPDTDSSLGLADFGGLWFNSSFFKIEGQAAAFRGGASLRILSRIHNIARVGWVEAVMETPAAGDFDAGLCWRGTGDGQGDLMYVTLCKSLGNLKVIQRVGNTETQIVEITGQTWENDTRYVLRVNDSGDTVSVFVDGEEVVAPQAVAAPSLTEHQVGVTAHHTRDSGTRFSALTWGRSDRPRRRQFPICMAHRGCIAPMPENSLVSLAALPPNIDGIEVDVARTADGVWVCMHDPTVDRTTNGTGAVASLQSEYVRNLLIDGGGGFVPTLTEYLDACQAKGIREVHIDHVSGDFADLIALMGDHPMADKLVLFLNSAADATTCRAISPSVRIAVGGITAANAAAQVDEADNAGVELCYLASSDSGYSNNRAVAVPLIQGAGMAVGASTVNRSSSMELAKADGARVMMSDYASMVNL